MNKFKIIHVADLGLKNHKYGGIDVKTGLNMRFKDVYRTLMFIVNKTIKNECQYIIIAGDINEFRNPDSMLIEKFAKQIRKLLVNNIKVIIVAGNHDVNSNMGGSTSISYLKALQLKNLYIVDIKEKSFTFEDDDVTFHCIPYMMKHHYVEENIDMGIMINNKIQNIKFNTKRNVLVSHYSTEDMFEGLNVDEVKLDLKNLKRFTYVALGHIHDYQMYNDKGINGGYTGSIYQKDFGEMGDKYVNLVTFNKNCTYEKISLPIRKFIEFEIDATKYENEELYNCIVDQLKGKVKDKIVKIKIKCLNRFNPKLIYEFLRNENVFYYVPIQWDIIREKKDNRIENINFKSDVDIIKEFLKTTFMFKKFKDDVLNFCKDIVK